MRPSLTKSLNGDASGDLHGEILDAQFAIQMSAQAVVTGTSTGTLNIQVSNDLIKPENWSNIATVGTVAIAGSGVYLIPKFDIAYRWVRPDFVSTNGESGTISVITNLIGPS